MKRTYVFLVTEEGQIPILLCYTIAQAYKVIIAKKNRHFISIPVQQ